MLVRALANVVLCYVPSNGVSFTTMERGHYTVERERRRRRRFAHAVAERLLPLAHVAARDRERVPHRPRARALGRRRADRARSREAGRRLDALGLLPAPFPIEELLDERDLRHVSRLYGIGGLSYGNLSARKDDDRFWMSASGVDKSPARRARAATSCSSRATTPANARMILSVSPNVEPRRVSVDAIEHWMIYQRASRRRRDPPRARVDGGHRRDRHQLPVRHGRAGRRRRGADGRRARSRRTP